MLNIEGWQPYLQAKVATVGTCYLEIDRDAKLFRNSVCIYKQVLTNNKLNSFLLGEGKLRKVIEILKTCNSII